MALGMEQHSGEQLRTARTARGVSQTSLARRTGIPQSAISRIENGHEVPSLERFRRLLAGLGLTADVSVAPLAPVRADPHHFATVRRMSPGQRVEQAAAWQGFAAEVRGKARNGQGRR